MHQLRFGRWPIAGLIATLMMDVGSVSIRATRLTAGLSPHLIGRWFASLARGGVVSGTIDAMPPVAGEVAIAAGMHYAIGISLTIVFIALLGATNSRHRSRIAFVSALAFGCVTNMLPWLWMFPSMGYGRFGSAAPREWMLMRSSFASHLLFGLGVALGTRWVGVVGSRSDRSEKRSSSRAALSRSAPIGR